MPRPVEPEELTEVQRRTLLYGLYRQGVADYTRSVDPETPMPVALRAAHQALAEEGFRATGLSWSKQR